jgi:hypothetical protein
MTILRRQAVANNLFVSYDLIAPDRDYAKVTEAVKSLGSWAKLEYSMFYVKSVLNAEQAAKHVWSSMTANDKLIVIDATGNNFYSFNLPADVVKHMQEQWYR